MKMLIDLKHLPKQTAEIKIKVSRRGIFTAAVDAAEEKSRSSQGAPSYVIENIAAFDAEQLSEILPAVNSRAKISLNKGIVYAETSASVDPIPLFDVQSDALFIFNQFNGRQPMKEVFVKVQNHTGWDAEKTQKTVRTVFLKLCEVRVCEPG